MKRYFFITIINNGVIHNLHMETKNKFVNSQKIILEAENKLKLSRFDTKIIGITEFNSKDDLIDFIE